MSGFDTLITWTVWNDIYKILLTHTKLKFIVHTGNIYLDNVIIKLYIHISQTSTYSELPLKTEKQTMEID